MHIRPEHPEDQTAIGGLTTNAFATAPHSDGTEAAIITRLRDAGALTVSLVAEEDGALIGHIAFSPVLIDGAARDWYGLGPVSVAPDRQGKGIGAALINHGLDRLRTMGAAGCVVLGDPAYYPRFGFAAGGLTLADIPPEYFMAQAFGPAMPEGAVSYHPAFYGDISDDS